MAAVELLIGVYGWEGRDWGSDYYPEDLPVEWRLDYCANALRLLVVPEQQLAAADCDDVAEWSEAADEGLVLLFETKPRHLEICDNVDGGVFGLLAPMASDGLSGGEWRWRVLNSVKGAPSRVAFSCFAQTPSPAELRRKIDQLVAESPEGESIAWVLDGKAAMVAAEQARVLVEMMGL